MTSARRLRLSDACHDALVRASRPIATRYDLIILIARIARDRGYQGASIYSLTATPGEGDYRRVVSQLTHEYKLASDPDFPAGIFTVNRLPDASPEEACCLVDPFAYVSHFSAMEHYGLTDRIPDRLIVTRPAEALWRGLADRKAAGDRGELGGALDRFGDVRPRRHLFPPVVRGRSVAVHAPKAIGRSVRLRESNVRMARIEQVFCDTLAEPGLCGGMTHVLEVWRDHARSYLDRIVTAVDAMDSPIAKVRAGYIVTEFLGIGHPIAERWSAFAQRGGSRRLDPHRGSSPVFSERWMLALNVDLPPVS